MRDRENQTHDSKQVDTTAAVLSEADFLAALNRPTQVHNKLHQIVELLIDIMWRECDWREGEWDALPPEQQQECASNLALDIECGFGRLGDPWKGCSPLEYLAMKAAEQEEYQKPKKMATTAQQCF